MADKLMNTLVHDLVGYGSVHSHAAAFIVEPGEPDECWIWTGRLGPNGYAHSWIWDGPRQQFVNGHRIVYMGLVGPIPRGLILDHLCRTKACVNPWHLEPVTNGENGRRHAALKTHCKAGHLLAGDNLIPANLKQGFRACLACHRARTRKQRDARSAAA
jgi:hypothetical protein